LGEVRKTTPHFSQHPTRSPGNPRRGRLSTVANPSASRRLYAKASARSTTLRDCLEGAGFQSEPRSQPRRRSAAPSRRPRDHRAERLHRCVLGYESDSRLCLLARADRGVGNRLAECRSPSVSISVVVDAAGADPDRSSGVSAALEGRPDSRLDSVPLRAVEAALTSIAIGLYASDIERVPVRSFVWGSPH
jgi:hypothetical protein